MSKEQFEQKQPNDAMKEGAKEVGEKLLQGAHQENTEQKIAQGDRYNTSSRDLNALGKFMDQMSTPEGRQAYLQDLLKMTPEALAQMSKESTEAAKKTSTVIAGLDSALTQAMKNVG